MADRDRFGESEIDYTNRENQYDVSSWRDTRAGGNIERANRGIPYPTGGRDVRFESSLPHKFSYLDKGRSVTSDVEPYWTDMGRNRSVTIPQSRTGTPNFRSPDRGSGAYLANQFGRGDGGGGLESLESKIDLNDIFNRFPGMNLWKLMKQLDKRGIKYAGNDTGIGNNEYQMAYSPGDYDMSDDDFTPSYIPPSTLEMDLIDTDYGPGDEYDFDRKRGYPGYVWGSPPSYSARGGLMSLRR